MIFKWHAQAVTIKIESAHADICEQNLRELTVRQNGLRSKLMQ